MFNAENYNHQSINIKPTCSGTLQKSHPGSFFKWFHVNSQYMEKLCEKPNVLQVMVFGDGNCLAEILPEEVYSKWIKED